MSALPIFFAAPVLLNAPARPAVRQRVLLSLLIILCAFSAILGRFCFLLRPFDNDAAIFIYMGRMVSNGGRLCHDLIDNKFPTVGLMTSIIYRALGTCWPAYVGLGATLSFMTSLSLGRTAVRASSPRAWLPTVLFSMLFLNLTTAVFGGFQLETMQVFFTALAAGAMIDLVRENSPLDGMAAGLCTGCGVLFKPTAGGVLVALIVVMFVSVKRPIRLKLISLLAIVIGLSLPLGAALCYLYTANLLSDMPGLYHQISTYAHQSVFDLVELLKPLTALALLGFPILIRGVVGRRHVDSTVSRTWAHNVDSRERKPRFSLNSNATPQLPCSAIKEPGTLSNPSQSKHAITLFLIFWLIVETAGVILQRRMYAYHFLPMVPPAALLFGMLPRLNRAQILAGALMPIALLSIVQAANLIATTPPAEARLLVSDYLVDHTKPGDAVWMDAWPRLILETNLRPASRLPFTFLFTNYDTAGLDYSAGIIADFERNRPAYIILPLPLDTRLQYQIDFIPELNRLSVRRASYLTGWHRIQQYTLANYDRETVIGNDAIYHRRSK